MQYHLLIRHDCIQYPYLKYTVITEHCIHSPPPTNRRNRRGTENNCTQQLSPELSQVCPNNSKGNELPQTHHAVLKGPPYWIQGPLAREDIGMERQAKRGNTEHRIGGTQVTPRVRLMGSLESKRPLRSHNPRRSTRILKFRNTHQCTPTKTTLPGKKQKACLQHQKQNNCC